MHQQARDFIAQTVNGKTFTSVVEFGGRNINGTVRDLFNCDVYTAVDTVDGAGVDVVADAATYGPDFLADVVVCCEVFEHTDQWPAILVNAYRILVSGGRLLVTAACDPRLPHSTFDGRRLEDGHDEWYANIDPDELAETCNDIGFSQVMWEVHDRRGDVYLTAVKP